MNEASQVIYVNGAKHDVAWTWIQDVGMNEATVVIFAGLLAALASVAAWKESGGGAPAGLRWSPTESWVTTSAVILAWVMTAYADPATGGDSLSGGLIGDNDLDGFFDPGTSRAPLVFGLILVLSPLIHRGLSGGGRSTRLGFGITAGVVAWAAFSVIIISSFRIAGLVDGYPLLPRLLVLAALTAAVLGVFINTARSLAAVASPDAPWTLP